MSRRGARLTHLSVRAGYIEEFEEIDDHRSGKLVVQLNGRINKTGVISCVSSLCSYAASRPRASR